MSTRLYVGNIPYSMTKEELQAMFAEFGSVTDVHIVMDRETGRPRGFAFVSLSTSEEASAAAAGLNERRIGGRPLVVNVARERGAGGPPRSADSRSGGGGAPHHRPAGGPLPRRPIPGGAPPLMPDEDTGKEDRRRARNVKKRGRVERASAERGSFRRNLEEEDEQSYRGSAGGWRKWIEEEDGTEDLKSPWRESDPAEDPSLVDEAEEAVEVLGSDEEAELGNPLAEKLRDSLGKKKTD